MIKDWFKLPEQRRREIFITNLPANCLTSLVRGEGLVGKHGPEESV
jgi:hypothetical protein